MAEAYDKGRAFEMKVAKMIRRKSGDKGAMRNKGSHANWNRRSDVFTNLPIHVEAKHHSNIRIKEWIEQAEAAKSFNETAVVAFDVEGEVMACLKFDELLNLFRQIADQQLEIEDLRAPVEMPAEPIIRKRVSATQAREEAEKLAKAATARKTAAEPMKMCKNGHIVTTGGKCMWKGCKYGIAAGKPKKEGK